MSKKILQDYHNLKEFNEDASHELQTPLAVITSKLDLLIQHEQLDESQLNLIQSIYEATTRMSRLNQGLLLISRIQNNQFDVSEEINIETILNDSLDHFHEMIGLQGIQVTKEYSRPMLIHMNRILAEILVNNLISNAIRYNVENGIIHIKMNPEMFSISNPGPLLKIDPNLLFQRFRKADDSQESVGLGLSIVQKICTLYQLTASYKYLEGSHTLVVSR